MGNVLSLIISILAIWVIIQLVSGLPVITQIAWGF